MPKQNVILIDHPDWNDKPIGNARFDHLMRYMYWIVQEIIDYAKTKGLTVIELDGDQCTRENIEKALRDYDPIAHIHGSHGGCNGLAGFPIGFAGHPSYVICSPSRGWCPTSDPCVPSGAVPCSEDNSMIDDGRVFYDIACLTARWLGEDRVRNGAKAGLAYNDLLFILIGDKQHMWMEEIFKECYNEGMKVLIDGGTYQQAYDAMVAKIEEKMDWVEDHYPEYAGEVNTALVNNRDILRLQGDGSVKIVSGVAPPPVQPPPINLEELLLIVTLIAIMLLLGWWLT